MKTLLAPVVLVIGLALPSLAQQLAVPKLTSSCPTGTTSVGGGYCKKSSSYAQYDYVPKTGGSCPSGFISAGGGYCRSR